MEIWFLYCWPASDSRPDRQAPRHPKAEWKGAVFVADPLLACTLGRGQPDQHLSMPLLTGISHWSVLVLLLLLLLLLLLDGSRWVAEDILFISYLSSFPRVCEINMYFRRLISLSVFRRLYNLLEQLCYPRMLRQTWVILSFYVSLLTRKSLGASCLSPTEWVTWAQLNESHNFACSTYPNNQKAGLLLIMSQWMNECMEGVCKMYEEHVKRMHPNSPSITYDIS